MQFEFIELSGQFVPGRVAARAAQNLVVLSDLGPGGGESAPRDQVSLKYVAAGVEIYRYGGKTYPVAAGQFLAVPPRRAGEVEISRSAGGRAKGMCLVLGWEPLQPGGLDAPMLFAARCSNLGRALARSHERMASDPHRRIGIAQTLVENAHHSFEPLLEETFAQLAGIDAARPATRYDLLRKLNVARSYLHSVDDRAVSLPELAKEAGISQFHLLRNFRSCFGLSPSAYHRRIRLTAGKSVIDRQEMSCGEAAHRFGFADASSFSHAYRRMFGVAPKGIRQQAGGQ